MNLSSVLCDEVLILTLVVNLMIYAKVLRTVLKSE